MAGILDSKTRIIDAVVTEVGRSQIANGQLKIEFASFSDSSTYYQAGGVTGVDNANMRIYFESPGVKPQDLITFETDDSGNLMGYPMNPKLSIAGDDLFKNNLSSSNINNLVFVSGSNDFASLSAGIVTSSIDHFKNLYVIGSSTDGIKGLSRQFDMQPSSKTFTITNKSPFDGGPLVDIADIDSVECLFLDKRLSHVPNFKFLPPIVTEPLADPDTGEPLPWNAGTIFLAKLDQDRTGRQIFLGDYKSLGENQSELTYPDIISNLNGQSAAGNDPDAYQSHPNSNLPYATNIPDYQSQELLATLIEVARERAVISFTETSETNNIIMQMFEIDSDKLKFKKLDVIDFGEVFDQNDTQRPNKHIFFTGKVFINRNKIPVFVNLFTIILD